MLEQTLDKVSVSNLPSCKTLAANKTIFLQLEQQQKKDIRRGGKKKYASSAQEGKQTRDPLNLLLLLKGSEEIFFPVLLVH